MALARDGGVIHYDPANQALTQEATLGDAVVDLAVAAENGMVVILGVGVDGAPHLWTRGADNYSDVATLSAGDPAAIAAEPGGRRFAVLVRTSNTVNHLYFWEPDAGLDGPKGYFASAGARDLMWSDPALTAGSPAIMTGDGVNGADSTTYILATSLFVDNGWSASFGNPGGGGWRPDGGYGMFTAWTTNKLYVFDGSWESTTLPNVPTGGSPNAIGWDAHGRRALIVGRAVGSPLRAIVVDHRPGDGVGFDPATFVEQSIQSFGDAPWFGTSNVHLHDVAWRPHTSCSEGLIVGADNGPSWSPQFGLMVRFYDTGDPDCDPL